MCLFKIGMYKVNLVVKKKTIHTVHCSSSRCILTGLYEVKVSMKLILLIVLACKITGNAIDQICYMQRKSQNR